MPNITNPGDINTKTKARDKNRAVGAVGLEFTWILIIYAFRHQPVRNLKKITNMGEKHRISVG